MTQDLDATVAAIRDRYDLCFGCGSANPIGLHLDDFAIDGTTVTALFDPRPEYIGFADVLHGGVVATLLDETLAWTAMLLEHTLVVTASLNVKFRKPAPLAAQYRVQGRVEQRRGRRLQLAGSAMAGEAIVAEANGLFVATEPIPQ